MTPDLLATSIGAAQLDGDIPAEPPTDQPPEIPWAKVSDFHWSADMPTESARVVYFSGPEGRFTAHLVKGSLDGEGAQGLYALSRPQFLRKVRSRWEVLVPREYRGQDNTHKQRHILQLTSPREQIVLRFVERVPRSLAMALRAVFEKKQYKLDSTLTGVRFVAKETP